MYAIIFFALSILLLCYGIALSGIWLFLVWPSVSFALLGAAYAWFGGKLLGKRVRSGTIAWWAWIVFFPYFVLTLTLWYLHRLLGREGCYNEVVPGICIGRRPFGNEMPPGIDLVVDLTAELPEFPQVMTGRSYICVPVLDASIPDEKTFHELIEYLRDWQGNIYVHCALGHGRSATVVATLLIARGFVRHLQAAERLLKTVRPGVSLNATQRHFVLNSLESFKSVDVNKP